MLVPWGRNRALATDFYQIPMDHGTEQAPLATRQIDQIDLLGFQGLIRLLVPSTSFTQDTRLALMQSLDLNNQGRKVCLTLAINVFICV